MKSVFRRGTMAFLFLLAAIPLRAGFASDQVFLPAVGRVTGAGGAEFFTTVWATNLAGVSVEFSFDFLRQGQANISPVFFTDSLAPGQTKVYENVIETKFGLTSAIGAARIAATGDILVSERIFNQAPGADLGDTEGLFFAAVPRNFSINLGQSASIQGLNQGGSENFRYNFALVETKGAPATANVQVFDENGVLLGQKVFALEPLEQLQPNVAEVVPGFSSINARITATVVDGGGSILLAGAQLANVSQDSSGFEMSFPSELLATGTSAAGVRSLNGLTGAVTLTPGNGISITPLGNSISIAATGGGSGALTLPFSGSTNSEPPAFQIFNNNASGVAITGTNTGGLAIGVLGVSGAGSSVPAPAAGVRGDSLGNIGVAGTSNNNVGVLGSSSVKQGIVGLTDATATGSAGVLGIDGSGDSGVAAASAGVRGESNTGVGSEGLSTSGLGMLAVTSSGTAGIRAATLSNANDHSGVTGFDGTGFAGVTGALSSGVRGESNTNIGVFGTSHNFAVVGKLAGPTNVQGELGSHRESADFAIYSFGNVKFNGTMTATGTKSFAEPHPTDPTKEIRYVCLEGPEAGTYFRGHGRIVGGFAKIDVPESFRDVSDENGMTVVATAVGGPGSIWVMKKALDQILLQANSDVEFDFVVNGVRKSYKDFAAIRVNESFIPDGPDDRRFALYAPEIQKRLVATGIYNADGTVNRETAKRLGWDREWKESVASKPSSREDRDRE